MKTKTPFIIGFAVIAASFIINLQSANATVGGSTYISNLRINSAGGQPAKEIMFVESNLGGKGCPPEIKTRDILTGTTSTLVDCDDDMSNPSTYDTNFKDTLNKFVVPLSRVHLKFSGITANVRVLKVVKEDPDRQIYFGQTDFAADIIQAGNKLATITYSGCTTTQPHVFEGYAIPGTNALALIVSTIGDCFEGGYTMERLYVIPGVASQNLNDFPLETRKEGSPATADADGSNGNILATAGQQGAPVTPVPTNEPTGGNSSPAFAYQIIIGLLILIILIIIMRSGSK